jgi:hypothetical protein
MMSRPPRRCMRTPPRSVCRVSMVSRRYAAGVLKQRRAAR